MKNYIRVSLLAAIAAVTAMTAIAGAEEAQNPVLQKARALAQEKNFPAAIDTVKSGLASGTVPDSFSSNLFLGTAYYKTGNYDSALAAFQKAIAYNNRSRMAYWFLGHIYEAQALAGAGEQKKAAQRNALSAWETFLNIEADNDALPDAHRGTGVSVESSNEQARRHIEVLKRELSHE